MLNIVYGSSYKIIMEGSYLNLTYFHYVIITKKAYCAM